MIIYVGRKKNSQSNPPDALPMVVANIRRIKLDAGGYEDTGKERIWWGTGLPLYRFDLRFTSGRYFDTMEVRARNPQQALKLIKERMPNVTGSTEI